MNLIEQYHEFCLNFLCALKKCGSLLSLTHSQVLCLYAIPYDGISQSELANKLSLDIRTLSRNLNNLIDKDLIYKKKSHIDHRSFIITLTEAGKAKYKKLNQFLNHIINDTNKNINSEEIHQMNELLNKINWQFDLYYKNNEFNK